MTTAHVARFALLFTVAVPATTLAQDSNKFALGTSFTLRAPDDTASHTSKGPGIRWRVGHSKNGWGWQYGWDWYSIDVNKSIGGPSTLLGELSVRPFMGGYGYTRLVGRVSLTADVIGGIAFSKFTVASDAREAYATRLGGQNVDVQMSRTPVVKPEVEMWMDLNRKIGLIVGAGYVYARPTMTVSSSLGQDPSQRFRANALTVTFGAVYKIR